MSDLRQYADGFFHFTQRERAGILSLVLLTLIVYLLRWYWPIPEDDKDYFRLFRKQIALLEQKDNPGLPLDDTRDLQNARPNNWDPFYFNPNTVAADQLSRFGWPQWLIQRFDKYRSKGGVFLKKEDVSRLYGLTPELFKKTEPYILLRPSETKNVPQHSDNRLAQPAETNMLELNAADSISLVGLKGIGPYMASKILRYRNALGGFVHFRQLTEIYGINAEQWEKVRPFLTVDSLLIRPLNLNTASFETLSGHPYLSGKEAQAIIKYRKQHGNFQSQEDLRGLIALKRETLTKLSPYLKF